MPSSKKQNPDKTEAFMRSVKWIDHSGYEGFCLGIDVLLHALGKVEIPNEIIGILERIENGEFHMPRRQQLSEKQRRGYDLFARQVTRRALDVLNLI